VRARFVEIVVKGDVRERLGAELDDVAVTVDHGVTRARVAVRDTSALYGILYRLDTLGVELLAVHDVDVAPSP